MITNRIKLAVVILACGSSLAISRGQTRDTSPASNQDIVQAVFHYELQQRSQERKWNVFYLAWGWDVLTVSDECVNDFSDRRPPVKKFIKSEFDVERIKKEKGLVLGVAEVRSRTEIEAEVEGYSFVVPGEAQGYRYSLARENGKWIVKGRKGTWTA